MVEGACKQVLECCFLGISRFQIEMEQIFFIVGLLTSLQSSYLKITNIRTYHGL